jgi:hypothetical protein
MDLKVWSEERQIRFGTSVIIRPGIAWTSMGLLDDGMISLRSRYVSADYLNFGDQEPRFN